MQIIWMIWLGYLIFNYYYLFDLAGYLIFNYYYLFDLAGLPYIQQRIHIVSVDLCSITTFSNQFSTCTEKTYKNTFIVRNIFSDHK